LISFPEDGTFSVPKWAPDGGRIVYLARKTLSLESSDELCTLGANGGQPSKLLSLAKGQLVTDFVWLSDERVIYYQQPAAMATWRGALWQFHADPRTGTRRDNPSKLIDLPENSRADQIRTTRDGNKITFMQSSSEADVYVADLVHNTRLQSPRRLTLNDRQDFPAAWLSDNRTSSSIQIAPVLRMVCTGKM
jgi:hypothetical protein